jgi:flagellar hook-associated protein 2
MSSSLSVMGMGSNVLNSDTITQLKTNAQTIQIDPIDKSIAKNQAKTTAFSTYTGMINDLSTTINSLSNETLYLQRNVSLSNSSIDVKAADGVDIQNFTISTSQLAANDTYQSKQYTSKDAIINSTGSNENLTLQFKGNNYDFIITNNMKLSDLNDQINNTLISKGMTSNILNTSGSSFSLVLNSSNTGIDNTITVNGDTNILNELNLNNVQHAQNAKFKFNNINMERSSNTFSDIKTGVEVTLKDLNSTTDVKIEQNTDNIKTQYKLFIDQYNNLSNYTKDITQNGGTNTSSGVFQNDSSTFNSILRNINNSLTNVISNNNLFQNGLSLDKSGVLSLDEKKFNNSNFSDIKILFQGDNGVFTKLKTTMDNITNSNSGFLKLQTDNLNSEYNRMELNKISTQDYINTKFDIMTNQFNAYDSIISNMNNNFSALNSLIQSSYSTKA